MFYYFNASFFELGSPHFDLSQTYVLFNDMRMDEIHYGNGVCRLGFYESLYVIILWNEELIAVSKEAIVSL